MSGPPRASRIQSIDPGLFSLKRAARAAIVMPAVFAFADNVIENPQTTILAAFGSFAILVLADFGGPRPRRLAAYLGLTVVGAALITLGTLCSRTPWLAVVAMAAIGFMVLLSGVISGYFAAGRLAALLTFILPVSLPAPPSAIPARLEGWMLAASVGTLAVMLLWPAQPRDRLRAGAARASRALADLLDSELSREPAAIADNAAAAQAAVSELRRSFGATPYRPTGPSGTTEALAFLVDALDWLLSFASPARGLEQRAEPCREENQEVRAAAVAVLRASAASLDGKRREPDLERLDRAREVVARTLARRIADARIQEDAALLAALEPSFRMRELSLAAREVAVNALLASGPPARQPRSALQATQRLVAAHASLRSASFRNSVRGAAGLALAVAIGQVATLQHSFWVVLATFSVLRSSALGTGSTVVQALAGTAGGIAVGGALLVAVGSDEAVLWALLPPALLLAAFAPQRLSFAAGQAGFTIVVLILFNIVQPTGWTVGLVRAEDVAIGCAVSLAVGLMFWPRGASELIRENLAAAYAQSADYVAAAADRLVAARGAGEIEPARRSARGAAQRLDDAFRDYLSESSGVRIDLEDVSRLVAGATRVRLGAYSLSTLAGPEAHRRADPCAGVLATEAEEVRSWYLGFADGLARRKAVAPPGPPADGAKMVRCVRETIAPGKGSGIGRAVILLWASEHLHNLRRLGDRLVQPASGLSAVYRPRRAEHSQHVPTGSDGRARGPQGRPRRDPDA